ncbi:hypothetical protein F5Y19DRAFT_249509 [Xylariaceae sp. FL1651]|nr:hypothetical protein F5Y19DRAFT_249509 [Xylariaceae sp. FL1651]
MASLRTPGLQRLPYELVAYIVGDLDIDDVFHWSLCSKHFQYIIREDRFCKPVVMAKASSTLEAQEALQTGHFSRALRRLAKRRLAVSQASPYVAGIVGCADSYEFYGGKLCYIIEARPKRWLRILDIHRSTDWELVVDIPALIGVAVPRAAKSRKYKFRVLYQAAGIISCLFSFALPQTENWLLIFKPQEQQILETFRLESAARIFVRNNEDFLYFGTHSGEGADGLKKWVIKGFDLHKLTWLPQPRMYLSNLAGSDIGTTVCFEIFNGYFYGLSNQTLFEVDDPNWTSHYYCFRFPLNEPYPEKTQVMTKDDSWRRQHYEGPIDDRWGFLSLENDESTGGIFILECRREWLRGQSGSRRTYYTTEAMFRQPTSEGDQLRVRTGTTRRLGDYPQNDAVRDRDPRYVHAGDGSSTTSMLIRSKTHYCSYSRCCDTFIDLFDDKSTDGPDLYCLRLRTGHRRLRPITGQPREPRTPDDLCPFSEIKVQPYQDNEIFIWPPDRDPSRPDASLDRVYELLNVKDHQGCVTATGDERSVIYGTSSGSKGGVKALVFLSFDPAARFEGMICGGNILGQRVRNDYQEMAVPAVHNGAGSNDILQFGPNSPMGAGYKVRWTADESTSLPSSYDLMNSTGHLFPPSLPAPDGVEPWAQLEKPMHLEIQRKLFFSR